MHAKITFTVFVGNLFGWRAADLKKIHCFRPELHRLNQTGLQRTTDIRNKPIQMEFICAFLHRPYRATYLQLIATVFRRQEK